MNSYETGRIFLGRLPEDRDLLEELTRIVEENRIKMGIVKVIGAVSQAKFGYYNQKGKEYHFNQLNQHLEIVSCIGNISILKDKPMVHAHIILADEKGNAYGGHLTEGTIIFAGEAFIQELKGKTLVRCFDESTGLNLW